MRGQLEAYFDVAFTAPDGVKRLRELILSLAVQGKLTDQRDSDEPASELLRKIAVEKKKLEKEGKIKKQKPLLPVGDDEKPYTLPKGWEWVRLGNVTEYIQRGKSPNYVDKSDYPVISQKSIQWFGFNKNVVRFVSEDSISSYGAERFVRKGDMLWNSTGTGTIGRINIYRGELDEYKRVVCDSHVTIVRPLLISCEYAILFLMSRYVQNFIEARASGTTNQIELNTTLVVEQILPLPPLAEQQRIVERVNSLMARCDALEAIHKEQEHKRNSARAAAMHAITMPQGTTDLALAFSRNWGFLARNFEQLFTTKQDIAELRKTILQLAVMGKLTDQRDSDEPASELLKKIAVEKKTLEKVGKIKKQKPMPPVGDDEKPYTLPKGWEWVRLIGIATLIEYGTSRKTHTNSTCVPVYRMGNIFNGELFNDSLKYIDHCSPELPRLFLKKFDILFNRTNSFELVGKSAIYYGENNNATFASYLIRIRLLLEFINVEFISISMNSDYYKRTQIDKYATQQCGQANFNGTKLGQTLLPLPPIEEQQRIVERVNSLMSLCDTLEERMEARTQAQHSLLNAVSAIV